eukprot:10765868-Ditylum_brightwellii.AAC.1
MHCAVTVLRSRVVMHYHLLTQTFGKNNKTRSWKEGFEEETGICSAQQEIKKNICLGSWIMQHQLNIIICQRA